jgi:hypothetical protein
MKMVAQLALAGLAGFVTLKLLGWLVLPILGLTVGIFGFLFKVVIVVLVGWIVLRLFRRERPSMA